MGGRATCPLVLANVRRKRGAIGLLREDFEEANLQYSMERHCFCYTHTQRVGGRIYSPNSRCVFLYTTNYTLNLEELSGNKVSEQVFMPFTCVNGHMISHGTQPLNGLHPIIPYASLSAPLCLTYCINIKRKTTGLSVSITWEQWHPLSEQPFNPVSHVIYPK